MAKRKTDCEPLMDIPPDKWNEAVRREAVIRPFADNLRIDRRSIEEAANKLGLSKSRSIA